MKSFFYMLYNVMLHGAIPAANLYAHFNKKVSEGIRGRNGFRERWTGFARKLTGNNPTVWFHVSSAGEFEQARPVMERLVEKLNGDVDTVLTFFSPSGFNFYERHNKMKIAGGTSLVDYLPFDTRSNMSFCLETLRPDVIVYTKYDVWPNLASEARSMGIPQILISAAIAPTSKMLLPLVRRFYKSVYSNLSSIAAISEEDEERFKLLTGNGTEIFKAGDTRFDRVYERAMNGDFSPPGALLNRDKKIVIAGSTWPPDEEVVIEGFADAKEKIRDTVLMIVPHEPASKNISRIEKHLSRYGLTHRLYSNLGDSGKIPCDCIIVDGVGFLAELYRYGTVAYVGGAFTTGVHSVLEPAVMGIPVLFGPKHENSREAREMIEAGAARSITNKDDFSLELSSFIIDEEKRIEAGRRAKSYIEENLGATEKCVDVILRYLEKSDSR